MPRWMSKLLKPKPSKLSQEVNRLVGERPVVIFSKTSCCMSHSIKSLICGFGANPTVYEPDKIPNGKQIERTLIQLACQPSVPAVFIGAEADWWRKAGNEPSGPEPASPIAHRSWSYMALHAIVSFRYRDTYIAC